MSITSELRLYARGLETTFNVDLLRIADRIEKAYEHAIAYASDRDPETMSKIGWMKLPIDADGVPIHVGDVMALQHEVREKPNVVQSLTWDGEDWYFTSDEGFFNACGWEHYHNPTVEDMLWELLGDIRPDMEDKEAVPIVAAYARRLRLADGEEQQ